MFLFKGSARTIKAKKNILISFIVKGASIGIGLLFVPLLLNYLDAERYGIWLTLSSVIGWFSFFDVGLGNGLRNRLAEAFATNNKELAKKLVSTTYAVMGILLSILIIIFIGINFLLDWCKILNTQVISKSELSLIALIVFIFFVLRLFFRLIGSILLADQRPALNNSLGPISNLLALIVMYIFLKTTDGSLIIMATALSISPVVVYVLANVFFFKGNYKYLAPSFKYVEFNKSKDLLSLGFKFFFFQISAIIFFSSTNFLIAQFSDQESVAAYNVAYKYLFVVNMIYAIVLSPFWSAVTDAYAKSDFSWLKKTIQKLNLLSVGMVILLSVLLSISPYVYSFWVGDKISIPFSLSIAITLYLIVQVLIAPFSSYINGIGKLKLGIYVAIIKVVLFFPLALLLGDKFGSIGVVTAMMLIQLPSLIIEPMQVKMLINGKAKGIWNK
ncbi:MAG: oligosaccharide flippase family protein [Bacteroidales bacterium]|nr:oligosaccharide flippase family protein [Bacteroidales bacterium]